MQRRFGGKLKAIGCGRWNSGLEMRKLCPEHQLCHFLLPWDSGPWTGSQIFLDSFSSFSGWKSGWDALQVLSRHSILGVWLFLMVICFTASFNPSLPPLRLHPTWPPRNADTFPYSSLPLNLSVLPNISLDSQVQSEFPINTDSHEHRTERD